MKNILKAAIQILICTVIQLPMMIIGLFAVAVGIPFRKTSGPAIPFTQYPQHGSWVLVRLPSWLSLWDNPIDGLVGDTRGYWANKSRNWNKYLAMWWWAAIRNPANNFKRFKLTCDISTATSIEKLYGQDYVRDDFNSTGWQLLKATTPKRSFYHFYVVYRWGQSNRALVLQFGFKFKLGDNSVDYSGENDFRKYKGFTCEINPIKDIS